MMFNYQNMTNLDQPSSEGFPTGPSLCKSALLYNCMRQLVDSEEYFNRRLIRNNRLLAGSLFFFLTVCTLLTGLALLPSPAPTNTRAELMVVTGVAVVQLVGLPLVWSASRNLQWSSLGVGLLVASVSFQSYFLAAALWNRVGVSTSAQSWTVRTEMFLDSTSAAASSQVTAVQAFKCGIANSIVVAAIRGRAGPLEAFIVSVLGTFLFELSRQLVSRYALDVGGSITIFLFAGCFGSTVAVMLYRWAHLLSAKDHPLRRAGKLSLAFAGTGSLVCWVFLPWLSLDCPASLASCSRAGVNGALSVSACVVTCVGVSCLVRGSLRWQELFGSPIAGGVAVASAGAFTGSPLAALLLGVVAGLLHLLFLQVDGLLKKYLMVENNVLFLFGLQGLLGGLASALFLHLGSQEQVYATQGYWSRPEVGGQLAGVGIAVGMGIGSGLLVGPILCWVRGETRCDHYHDRAYWIMQETGKEGSLMESEGKESSSAAEHVKSETVKETTKNRFAML